MANFRETPGASFDPVRRIERNDPVLGGDPEIGGVVNSPYNYLALALVNRDIYLKEAIQKLAATIPAAVVDASTTVAGKVRLATLPEMRAGTHKTAVATAEGVQEAIEQISFPDASVPDATTAQKGKVELATRAEARARTSENVVITPDALDEALDNLPSATTSVKGLAEIATETEVKSGSDNKRYVTPDILKALLEPVRIEKEITNFRFSHPSRSSLVNGNQRITVDSILSTENLFNEVKKLTINITYYQSGRHVSHESGTITLTDYTTLPRRTIEALDHLRVTSVSGNRITVYGDIPGSANAVKDTLVLSV